MSENTLKITFKQQEEHRAAARDRLRHAEAGETGQSIAQDDRFILNFETFDDVDRLMRTTSLELIEIIVSDRPESIRQAAIAVDRDYREVHRNLKELEALGVIEFADPEDGHGQRPILRGGAETIDFSIRFPGSDDAGESTGASA